MILKLKMMRMTKKLKLSSELKEMIINLYPSGYVPVLVEGEPWIRYINDMSEEERNEWEKIIKDTFS